MKPRAQIPVSQEKEGERERRRERGRKGGREGRLALEKMAALLQTEVTFVDLS
jgi:hypothetical protein